MANRCPQRQHAVQPALNAIGKVSAALAFGIDIGRREAIGVPSRELIGIAFANLIGSKALEQPEVHFSELVDGGERRRVAGDDLRAFGRA